MLESPRQPRILARPEHPISRRNIDERALKVLSRLDRAGYRGYLCGGGVRDLMLGRKPKDFDVVTDARPNQIRQVFRNARIIGRRFRLAHVLFHDGIVEVATFRGPPDPEEQKGGDDGELLITSDNTFGTPETDAFRRDFTINALFYDIADFSVIDWVGGIEDIERGLVRVIGEPAVRFAEDPVRMLRACEFAGRLGFTIEARTQEGIQSQRAEVLKASPARLAEELLSLLRSGHAGSSVQWMLELGLVDVLLPEMRAMLDARRAGAGDFSGILPTLDGFVRDGRASDDVVLLGSLFLPQLMLRRFAAESAGGRVMPVQAFRAEVEAALQRFGERFTVPNHKKSRLVAAFDGFHRMCGQRFTPAQRRRLAEKSYFPDAVALFEVLVRATGEGETALDAWLRVAASRPEPSPRLERRAEDDAPLARRPRRRRRRR